MVEHLPYKQAVIGSSPIVPTIVLYEHIALLGAMMVHIAGVAQW